METVDQYVLADEEIMTCPIDHKGNYLLVRRMQADNALGTPIILMQDICDPCETLAPAILKFQALRYNVYCYNARINSVPKGETVVFAHLVSDLLQVIALVKSKESGAKPVVIAQGVNGLVALFLANTHAQFMAGVALITPILSLKDHVPPLRRFLMTVFAQFFPASKLPRQINLRVCNVSNINHQGVSSALALDLLNISSASRKLLNRLRVPCLLIYPSADPIGKFDFLKRIVTKHKNPEKIQLVDIKKEIHLLLNADDETLQMTVDSIAPWLADVGPSIHRSEA